MDSLINRYRNITVLLLVILAQLVLLALQVRNDQDVRMIRVWSVTAVTPVARTLETLRSGTFGVVKNYFLLRDMHEENRRIKADLDRLKIENVFLRTELSTADRAKALAQFQSRTPSRTLASRVIATGAGTNSKLVYVDAGSSAGVMRGMAVVTPDGIVGKVLAAYPTASEVLLVTDPDFAAGVVSQKTHVRGTLKGQGYANCKVDYVANEEKVEVGELFFTSGDDRIFPKGFPAGIVRVVRRGTQFKEIHVEPTGLLHGLEEVLILLEGVHQIIPDAPPPVSAPIYIAPPPPDQPAPVAVTPPGEGTPGAVAPNVAATTEADRLLQRYKSIGDAQGHKFGEGLPGSRPPDFNYRAPAAPAVASPAAPAGNTQTAPAPSTAVPQARPPAAAGTVPNPQPRPAVPPEAKAATSSPHSPAPAGTAKPEPP
ncbi:MAG TPA: rod shape-determining protein MreC, partial [Bryobacteraceae bacterium]|nr:rod shape-determining protein MreC [Bryobacteraceae bacterium]